MPIWQDATVNATTGAIDLSGGPDAVRLLGPQYVLAGNTAKVGFGVQVIMGGGGGGTDPLAPGAPVSIAVVMPITNPPSFDVVLVSGSGAPLDTVATDVVELGVGSQTVDYSDTLDAAEILAEEVTIANGTLSEIARTPYARIKRPGTPDRYSAWTAGASYTVPAASGGAGEPIGLLLILTKAA